METTYILTLSCPQRPGIVHAVSAFLFQHGCDIVEHQQFDDTIRDTLFLRTEFVSAHDPDAARSLRCLRAGSGREVRDELPLDRDRPAARAGHGVDEWATASTT